MSAGRFWFLWSPSQNAFHVESEADGCRTNLEAFMLNRPLDFIPLGVFTSESELEEFAAQLRARRDARQAAADARRGAAWN